MNKKLKRALGSVFAFAILFSIMTIANVTCAFAAADYEWSNGESSTDFFTVSGSTGSSSKYATTYNGTTYTNYLKLETNSGSIIFTPSKAGIFLLVSYNGVTKLKVNGNSTAEGIDNSDEAYTLFTLSCEANTTYTIGKGSGSPYVVYMSYTNSDEDLGDDEPVLVTDISVSPTTATTYVGKTTTLATAITPSNATNKAVTWSSSDTTVATVAGGVVTGVKAGTVTITATSNDNTDLKASAEVTVLELPVVESSGTGSDILKAASATTVYDFRAAAENVIGNSGLTDYVVFPENYLYFNNEVYIGSNLNYSSSKYSQDIDDSTTSKGGLRLKQLQGEVVVKLTKGSTIEVPVCSGGSSTRVAFISSISGTQSDANSSTGYSSNSAEITPLAVTNTLAATSAVDVLKYTATENITVYISATNEVYFSQIKVTVPEPTYTILTTTSDSNGVAVISKSTDATEYIIVSVISADKAAQVSALKQTNSTATKTIAETGTVYKAISVNGTEYTAENFGGSSSDYLFASKLSVSDATSDISTTIQEKVVTAIVA